MHRKKCFISKKSPTIWTYSPKMGNLAVIHGSDSIKCIFSSHDHISHLDWSLLSSYVFLLHQNTQMIIKMHLHLAQIDCCQIDCQAIFFSLFVLCFFRLKVWCVCENLSRIDVAFCVDLRQLVRRWSATGLVI